MNVEVGPSEAVAPAEAVWMADQRKWVRGWRRIVFPGVFLVYLVSVVGGVNQYSHGAAAMVGYLLVVAFAACYLCLLPSLWRTPRLQFSILYGALFALFVAEIPFARDQAFVMCVFIAVITVARFGTRAISLVSAMTLAAVLVPVATPSWHAGATTAVDNGTAIAIPMVSLAMLAFFNVLGNARALAEARSELARLAAENERTRIARDLHDLLGHSLTTITVKAELARRLAPRDQAAAFREIADVEALSRRALGDVRAAVANYREVTLAGELATGRELLRAAGITANLPQTADVVDTEVGELFGWVLREGLTNVARHSHASACTVHFSGTSVEIVDDGVGGQAPCGNGLTGLRERVEAAGGVIEAGPASPRGWRVRVSLGRELGSARLAGSMA